MTANQINYAKLLEDQRHNQASEFEVNRANVAGEAIGRANAGAAAQQAAAATQNAGTNYINAQTRQQELALETKKWNYDHALGGFGSGFTSMGNLINQGVSTFKNIVSAFLV